MSLARQQSIEAGSDGQSIPAGPLWVYDDVCVFCSASIRFLLAHERDHSVRFVSMRSDLGRRLLAAEGLDPADPESFVFIENGRAWTGSEAACLVVRHLRWPWRALGAIRLAPLRWRDATYRILARTGTVYSVAWKQASAPSPSPELRRRFIE